jgi:hypothetical protein
MSPLGEQESSLSATPSLRVALLGDIFIEDKRGHYRSGTTEKSDERAAIDGREN